MLTIKKISNYSYVIRSCFDFKVTIKMNPRDSAVSVKILKVPEDETERNELLRQLSDYLKNRVGGKICISLGPKIRSDHFPPSAIVEDARYIDIATLKKLLPPLAQHICVEENLDDLGIESENYQFLQNPEDYTGLYDKLFKFKRENAPFVNEGNIAAGLYSAKAEAEKIRNKFVKHFAIFNRRTQEFTATLEVFVDGDMAHVSDLIVHRHERSHKFAETIMLKAFERFEQTQLKGVWFIAPKLLSPGMREYFFSSLLQSVPIDEKLQTQLGIRLLDLPPARLLLDAMNRGPRSPYYTLDSNINITTIIKHGFFAVALATVAGTALYYASEQIQKRNLS